MILHNLVEQLQEWAKDLETADASKRIGIIAGLREVAADVARSTTYAREEKLGNIAREERLTYKARAEYAVGSDNTIEIDDDPDFSQGDDGVWISAWVWVPEEDDGG